MKRIAGLSVLLAMGMVSMPASADEPFKGELTPYLWAVGIDGDVTVRGREQSIDVGFSDLLDKTDAAGSLLGVLQYGKVVFWGQVDYLSLSTDELDNAPSRGSFDSDTTIATLAVGYQFGKPGGRTLDVLGGVRRTSLDNELELNTIGSFENDIDFTDAVVVLRPSFPFSERWRFNPTLSFGAGDSDLTYELWPQFQYRATDRIALRIGYRRMFYDAESSSGNSLDANFHGFVLGVGGIW